jgi:hypothetical protein
MASRRRAHTFQAPMRSAQLTVQHQPVTNNSAGRITGLEFKSIRPFSFFRTNGGETDFSAVVMETNREFSGTPLQRHRRYSHGAGRHKTVKAEKHHLRRQAQAPIDQSTSQARSDCRCQNCCRDGN